MGYEYNIALRTDVTLNEAQRQKYMARQHCAVNTYSQV
jgi:hypothetical protein